MNHDVVNRWVVFVQFYKALVFALERGDLRFADEFLKLLIELLKGFTFGVYLIDVRDFVEVWRNQVAKVYLGLVFFGFSLVSNRFNWFGSNYWRFFGLIGIFLSFIVLIKEFDKVFCILIFIDPRKLVFQFFDLNWPEPWKIMAKSLNIILTILIDKCYQLICLISNFFKIVS